MLIQLRGPTEAEMRGAGFGGAAEPTRGSELVRGLGTSSCRGEMKKKKPKVGFFIVMAFFGLIWSYLLSRAFLEWLQKGP